MASIDKQRSRQRAKEIGAHGSLDRKGILERGYVDRTLYNSKGF